jgi:DNA-binding response OmpR family regulator
MKVLIIDDNIEISKMLSMFFVSYFGAETITRNNGRQAIDYIINRNKQRYYDLIMTDFEMPELNGIEFIKLFTKYRTIEKIICMSGNFTNKVRKDFMLAGANFCLWKPFEFCSLEKIVRKLVFRAY